MTQSLFLPAEWDEDLLSLSFKLCAVDEPSAGDTSRRDLCSIFDHTLPIQAPESESLVNAPSAEAIRVVLTSNEEGDLLIQAPREAIRARDASNTTNTSKRRRGTRKGGGAHGILARLTSVDESARTDGLLCSALVRSDLPIAFVEGPYLVRKEKSRAFLRFRASLVMDAAVTSRSQQNHALRFLARAFDDPSLLDPLSYQASPLDLLRVITKHRSQGSPLPTISLDGLRTELMPYQIETVNWCLKREGMELVASDRVAPLDVSIRDCIVAPPLGWRKLPQSSAWVNPYLLRTLSSEPQHAALVESAEYQGRGILAEEMGLGKTLEMISLIMLNPRQGPDLPGPGHDAKGRPYRSKASLVIVPRTILQQWVSEVKLHAPHLKVTVVTNPNPSIEDLLTSDIVLVTYGQLSRWLPHTAVRHAHEKRKNRVSFTPIDLETEAREEIYHSTLIDVQFWRVVLDEVQMVHTGSSSAAQVARRIPRVHAWAASGTPTKHSLEDLRGIIYFLDLVPYVQRPCWQRLISSPIDFPYTMELVAVRHTKAMVADQLVIPKQNRRLLLLRFSAIERARYDRLYKEFVSDATNSNCNLSAWLLRLRQACSHAITAGEGSSQKLGAGSGLDGEVLALTLDQVLTQLVEEADQEVWVERREKMHLQLQLGQLYDVSYQMPLAMKEWNSVVEQAKSQLAYEESRVAIFKKDLNKCQERVEELEKILDKSNRAESSFAGENNDVNDDELEAELESRDLSPVSATKNQDLNLLDAKRALAIAAARLKSSKLRCRSLRELLHRAYFFLGTGYFRSTKRLQLQLAPDVLESEETQAQIKANFEHETNYYNLADQMRSEILNEASERVLELSKVSRSLKFIKCHRICPLPKASIADKLATFVSELFEKLDGILTQPLLEEAAKARILEQRSADAQSDAGGGERTNSTEHEVAKKEEADAYTKTLDLQEFAFIMIEMLQILLRDRAATINGGNVQPRVQTLTAENAEPEAQALALELIEKREELVSTLHYDRSPLSSLMRTGGVDERTISKLKGEIRSCQSRYSVSRDLYNCRVEFYKQLQDLSDQVTDIDIGDRTDYDTLILQKCRAINLAERRIHEKQTSHTYLRNLEGNNHGATQARSEVESKSKEENSICTICLEVITDGALTPCGHSFCESCLFSWLSTHSTCPLCKRRFMVTQVLKYRSGSEGFTAGQGQPVKEEAPSNDANEHDSDDSHASDLFIQVPNKLYNKIHSMPTARMHGVKIDMIMKHAQYIRSQDPSAQIVIFSQWGLMLRSLKTAFKQNGVLVATLNDETADLNAFRTSPDVACLLLHAKADVAGLTLVNANHVFLCEPLLNTALELQAVSRVNRIGQTRETTVWQFCVEDTVEQTILGVTTKDRLLRSHVNVQDEDESAVAYEEAAAQSSFVDRRSGAELVDDSENLRRILFSKQTRDQMASGAAA